MNKHAFQPIQPISFIQKQATCKKTTYTAKIYPHTTIKSDSFKSLRHSSTGVTGDQTHK